MTIATIHWWFAVEHSSKGYQLALHKRLQFSACHYQPIKALQSQTAAVATISRRVAVKHS